MDQSESVESSLSVIFVVVYYVCVNLHLQLTLGTKSANVVRFVSTFRTFITAVIRVKPASQTNMLPRSLGTNGPVALIVIYALLIWPSIEGRKYNCSVCIFLL